MSADVEREAALGLTAAKSSLTTPAGFEAIGSLTQRRLLVLALNMVTWACLIAWAAAILSIGGWSLLDGVLLTCFIVGTPWSVVGFWNALIGLWRLHAGHDGIASTAPFLAAGGRRRPLTTSTAVLMTLRNEDPARALLRLKTVKASLDATGEGGHFSYFVLSDTDDARIAGLEDDTVTAWRAADPDRDRIHYRRRPDNTDYKAGNIRDFCATHGHDFELMLPLDADSLMTGEAVVRLARIMDAHPRIGILQSLVVGTPSSSAFARLFQFGMRHGMRTYTMGQAWWTGDCGPFWGHNALVRIAPFYEHCALQPLPGAPPLGGPILSHDQVEAALMRSAGFEVRVVPVECGSYEDNPPDVIEFMRRDLRWCQGNLQYLKLLGLPGLKPVSRTQLLWAILMFIGVPAWTLMIALLPFAVTQSARIETTASVSTAALYLTVLGMYLSPKLAGIVDSILTSGEVARFGGWLRFSISAVMEIVFSFLLAAVTTLRTTIFMIGLVFGASVRWDAQRRDVGAGLTWREAAHALWPQLMFGLIVCSALFVTSPMILAWSLPLTAGYLLAIPFAVWTARPELGRFMRRHGLAAIPEDIAAPAEIAAIQKSGA